MIIHLFPATLMLFAGCPSGDGAKGDSDDESGGYVDTGDVTETGETGETDDTGDTGDTGVEAGLAALDAWPGGLTVNVGAIWTVRVVGTDTAGVRAVYDAATFASDDPAVATVDGRGVVTAVAAGGTTIEVTAEGFAVRLEVVVRAALEATVTVLDAATGAPIANASVWTNETEVETDAAGLATVSVADAGPINITAWETSEWVAVSVLDTISRDVTLTLKRADDGAPSAQLHGDVDFASILTADAGEEVFGLASGSVQGPLPLFQIDDLLAADRTLVYYGVDVAVPSNLFVKGYLEDYYADSFPGPVAVWGLGGPVPIAELAAGLSGTGDAMRLLIDHLDDLRWGVVGGLTASAGATTEAPLAPSVAFVDAARVALPSLPAGFDGTEEQLVCTFDGGDDGWVLTGLAMGAGVLDVRRVPPGSVPGSDRSAIWTMAQVGGIGSGPTGIAVAAASDDGASTMDFPDFLDIPTIDGWSFNTRQLDLTVDADASLVRMTMVDPRGRVHELYAGGSWSGVVDKHNDDFQRPTADITLQSLVILDGSFEQGVTDGTLDPAAHDVQSVSSCLLAQ
ncbi:MAG: hypothetical protein EXR71_03595 [Myxococcales bacterium]|nr:hypothetical protein [Myxococcales bacterium]